MPTLRQIALLIAATSCHRAPPAEAPTKPFDERAHCDALGSITGALGLYADGVEPPATRVELREGEDHGDLYESRQRGTLIPSGFDVCEHHASRSDGLNWHVAYTCTSSASSRARHDEIASAWRRCFRDSPSLREARKRHPEEVRFELIPPDPPLGYPTQNGTCELRHRDRAMELECRVWMNN